MYFSLNSLSVAVVKNNYEVFKKVEKYLVGIAYTKI